jgi:hypothetical protein
LLLNNAYFVQVRQKVQRTNFLLMQILLTLFYLFTLLTSTEVFLKEGYCFVKNILTDSFYVEINNSCG